MTHTTPPAPAPAPVPAPPPAPTPKDTILGLRAKYRSGLITLGEFLAFLDRWLDGVPLGDIPLPDPEPLPAPVPAPTASKAKAEKDEVKT